MIRAGTQAVPIYAMFSFTEVLGPNWLHHHFFLYWWARKEKPQGVLIFQFGYVGLEVIETFGRPKLLFAQVHHGEGEWIPLCEIFHPGPT